MPSYVDVAESMGANALKIPGPIWSLFESLGESTTLNEAFLDASISRGQQFYLATQPLGQSGAFAWELTYLSMQEYGPSTWIIVPLPY
jgi:hypothetical protein